MDNYPAPLAQQVVELPLASIPRLLGMEMPKAEVVRILKALEFTVEEAAALYLGRQFLEPLAGTYFFDGAQRAFQKIRATLGDAALRHLEKLAAAFYQKTPND